MSIRIGASCVGRHGFFTSECRVAEIRFLRGNFYPGYDYHPRADEALAKCRQYNIYPIVSVGFYQEGREYWHPSENEYRHCIEILIQKLYSYGFGKNTARITCENEPMKHLTREEYSWYVNLTYDQVDGRFYVGAGNEEFGLAAARGWMYEYICKHCNFDYLDIHIQASCITPQSIEHWGNYAKNLATEYNKKLSCTEANWFDVATSDGYGMLLKQLIKAEEIGCEDFCMVFITLSGVKDRDCWLAFICNNRCRNWNNWLDFIRIIKEKEPKPVERSKDGMILPSVKLGSKGYLTELVEELLQYNGQDIEVDGYFDEKDVEALKNFQRSIQYKYPNVVVDGICGRKGYYYLIQELQDVGERRDFQFKLEVFASPMK